MVKNGFFYLSLILCFISQQAFASTVGGKYFDRVMIVIFENVNYSDVIKQPFFKSLADRGALFSNFMAITHPSQGNYVALTSGDLNGVTGDGNFNLNVSNIVDLLEAKGLTWKVYAESYPGHCFTGKQSGTYARKHNPFISYVNIQKNQARCAKISDANQFDVDLKQGALPNYIFYVPDMKNDGHDTDVSFADKWYKNKFATLFNDPKLMENTIVISTFDESGPGVKNQIYTSIIGPMVKPIVVSDRLNTYSLLRMIEENWGLQDLGKHDVDAPVIGNIWE